MKKQFLLIVSLAFVAGTFSFGQNAVHNSIPRPISCLDDAGHPIAGKPYTYEALGTPTGGSFLFWATKDPNFIATAAGVTTNNLATRLTVPANLLATSANYATQNAADTVSITWSDATLNGTVPGVTPTFVAVHYTAPAAGCADNFNAWEIQPIKAFIVDIKNIDDATRNILAYNAPDSQCVDIVRGAQYVGGTVNFNFGADTLYFEVVAANFSGSWTPTFAVNGLGAVETAAVTWTYDLPATWNGSTTWNPAATVVLTTEPNISLGVSIYARVIVTHNNFEGIAPSSITLVVDGQNTIGDWDIANNLVDGSPSGTCVPALAADQLDVATQVLKARPTLTPVNPTPFLPTNKQ
jgi:hypothetical protein